MLIQSSKQFSILVTCSGIAGASTRPVQPEKQIADR